MDGVDGLSVNSFDLENNKEEQTKCEVFQQEKLSESKILNIIINHSQDTLYFKDKDSKFVANSRSHVIQCGFDDPKDLVGKSDFDFFPESFARQAREDELRIMETGEAIIGKLEKWVTKEDDIIWFSASKYPIYDSDGDIIGTWGTSRDITSLKLVEEELARVNAKLEEANSKLHKLSTIDGLSELCNQRRFYEVLEETMVIYKRKRMHNIENNFCIMMIDIDSFKLINDTYGHPIGDMAIKYVADLISANTRASDMCFRCGGDEFAVILLDTDLMLGIRFAERIRKVVEESNLRVENRDYKMTVSVGIAGYQDEKNVTSLLAKADSRLYRSKSQGKNQVN